MFFLGSIYCASIGFMSIFHHLWQWYVAAIFSGIGMSCCMVVVPITLNNWFKKRNGLVIGITMSASCVAAALFSPICSAIIDLFGWRTSCLVMAAVGAIFILLPSIFLPGSSPAQAGCLPYGSDQEEENVNSDLVHKNLPLPHSYIFFFALMAVLLSGNLLQFNNQLPTFAASIGYPISVGAALTSFSMVGKLALGSLSDRIGIYRTIRIFLTGVFVSMLLFISNPQSAWILYAAALLFGTIYALSTTAPSLLFLDLYGPETYREKVSHMQTINGIVSALISVVFPYLYDWTGSFHIVFFYGIFACISSMLLFFYLQHYSQTRLQNAFPILR